MSTPQQKYSIENQLACIREYAALNGFELTRLYADEGKSGLRVQGRTAFQNLINEIKVGKPDFLAILVYDVSRWGRFQSSDEAAFHEHTFAKAGVRIHYCAELFENNDSLSSSVIKAVKRVMAGEFSKDLSRKVVASQSRLSSQGFRQGGFAGHGLRRAAVDQNGSIKRIMYFGDRKANSAQRTILIHGPQSEMDTVQKIYRLFVEDRLQIREIRDRLNREKVPRDSQYPRWTSTVIKGILTNEKYTGQNVYNKRAYRLREKSVRNDSAQWIRSLHRFSPIVDQALFSKAQERFKLIRRCSDKELISQLRGLYKTYGFLTGTLINSQRDMRTCYAYACRFGGLKKAYKLAGCTSLGRTIPARHRRQTSVPP